MFYDWSECVMSVHGTTKHSSCNQCIDTWQYSYIILYCIVLGRLSPRRLWFMTQVLVLPTNGPKAKINNLAPEWLLTFWNKIDTHKRLNRMLFSTCFAIINKNSVLRFVIITSSFFNSELCFVIINTNSVLCFVITNKKKMFLNFNVSGSQRES